MNDEDIRSSFEKIVWVSIGQEPDIRELQESLYEQIAGSVIPPDAKTPSLVFKALRDASKGCNMLLVLDDAWDAQTEKSLSCIDLDNSSRLLVTTRIRGLLKNSAEVELGVLPKEEALKLDALQQPTHTARHRQRSNGSWMRGWRGSRTCAESLGSQVATTE